MSEDIPKGTELGEQALRNAGEIDAALRPPTFADFTGQRKTLERLQVMVGAAVKRGRTPQAHITLRSAWPWQNNPRPHHRP